MKDICMRSCASRFAVQTHRLIQCTYCQPSCIVKFCSLSFIPPHFSNLNLYTFLYPFGSFHRVLLLPFQNPDPALRRGGLSIIATLAESCDDALKADLSGDNGMLALVCAHMQLHTHTRMHLHTHTHAHAHLHTRIHSWS